MAFVRRMIMQLCPRGDLAVTVACGLALAACASAPELRTDGTVEVPAGDFLMGSGLDERALALEAGYAGRGRVSPEATAWMKGEFRRKRVSLGPYFIMTYPVTQAEYLAYVRSTGAAEPYVDPSTWAHSQVGHSYRFVEPFLWEAGQPRDERMRHPVVLVSRVEAASYCSWWGVQRGGEGSLPSEAQWEKAARGTDGRAYPWGNEYAAGNLNSAEAGPGDTVAVGLFDDGVSPFGAHDMAGNVFEWTRTRGGDGEYIVKGGGFSSHADTTRAAARHARPEGLRHVAVGFRCVLVPKPEKKKKKDEPERDRVAEGRAGGASASATSP